MIIDYISSDSMIVMLILFFLITYENFNGKNIQPIELLFIDLPRPTLLTWGPMQRGLEQVFQDDQNVKSAENVIKIEKLQFCNFMTRG